MTHETRHEMTGPEPRLSPQQVERFSQCVMPYLDSAHNLARHLLRDAQEAEDAVQEAFLRAMRHFDGFRGSDGRAWILAIVRNTCLSLLRRRRVGGEKVEFDEAVHSVDTEGSEPLTRLERAIAVESLREGLDRLPVEYREALVLRELEGLSYKEIAQVAGVPIGTVMSRLARGRRQLTIALRAREGERLR